MSNTITNLVYTVVSIYVQFIHH